MSIHIGCSGWSYPEWSGSFYPKSARPSLRLYSNYFETVEINSTFYNIPRRDIVDSWIKQLNSNADFRFSVKVPRQYTHPENADNLKERLDSFNEFVETVLNPLRNAGRLKATMFGLPPWIGKDNYNGELRLIGEISEPWMIPFVEARNRQLLSGRDFFERCSSIGLGAVTVDSPDNIMNNILPTNGTSYIRLHGRNRKGWNERGAGMEKYNYNYSEKELEDIGQLIKNHEEGDVTIYFNNHPFGNAPVNALSLIRILGIKIKTGQSML